MTTADSTGPDEPGPGTAGEAGVNGWPDGDTEADAADGGDVSADPAVAAPGPDPAVPDPDPPAAEPSPAAVDEQAAVVTPPDDPVPASTPEVVQRDAPQPTITPQASAPPGDAAADDPARDRRPRDDWRTGSSANGLAGGTVPPWPHTATSAHEVTDTARGPYTQPDYPHRANQPRADPRPPGPAYEHSPSFVPTSQAPPRYGRPVAQPFNTQSSRGAHQNFSQPTVRIGGRVQPEQVAAQPPNARMRPTRIPRRASLQLRYLEPWSVLKVSLVLSVAGFLAWMVAVGVLYSILGGMGVWDQLNGTYSDLTSVSDPQAGDDLISAGGVFGVAALVGMVNIVLITAMCTVGAFIYNASADLAGGIEVTLSERD